MWRNALLVLFMTVNSGALWAIDVGDQAPPFELSGSDGQVYTLTQFVGEKPVVIAWFPKAFTGG